MNRGTGKPIGTDEDDNSYVKDPMMQVFYNDMLLDIILEKTIEKEKAGFLHDQIFVCRLVSKSFLGSISRILKKHGTVMKVVDLRETDEFIENVEVDEDETVEHEDIDYGHGVGNSDDEDRKPVDKIRLLERTIHIFSSPDRLPLISILPFTLYLDGNDDVCKIESSANVISKFFAADVSSSSLSRLYIWFPKTTNNFLKLSEGNQNNNLTFQNLLKLKILGYGNGETDLDIKLAFICQIVEGSGKLQSFELRDFGTHDENGLASMRFPSTIRNLVLEPLSSTQLQKNLLINNPLLKLVELIIYFPDSISNKDAHIIEKILEKFQYTLTCLYIYSMVGKQPSVPVYSESVRVPLMKNLKSLVITGCFPWTWKSWNRDSSLANCLPTLELFDMVDQNDVSWVQIVDGGIFDSVTDFQTNIFRSSENSDDNLSFSEVGKLCNGFPNLTSLRAPVDQLGLQILFSEMRQLTTLKIHVELTNRIENKLSWTLALLGITEKDERKMSEIPGDILYRDHPCTVHFWENEEAVSITDLSRLTYLKLSCELFGGDDDGLLSDLVFYLGFMKMENLKDLEFVGGFKISQRMIRDWEEKEGCTISYTDEVDLDDF